MDYSILIKKYKEKVCVIQEELALEYVKTDKLMNLSSLNELWVTILIASINKSYFKTQNEEYK